MEIKYSDNDLEKCARSFSVLKKKCGTIAKKIRQRLDELEAFDNLNDLPPRTGCHPLTGDAKGCFSVTLNKNFRLIFEPDYTPLPLKPDGGIDGKKITKIKIIKLKEDYHGK